MCLSGCVPWPCLALVGKEDPHICQHYVQAPTDVTVELVQDSNPTSDSVVISWKPSYYGAYSHVCLSVCGGVYGFLVVAKT